MDLIDREKLLEAIDEDIRISVRSNHRDVLDRYIFQVMSIIYKQPKVDVVEELKDKDLISRKKLPYKEWRREARMFDTDSVCGCANAKWLLKVIQAQNDLIYEIADIAQNASAI